MNRTAQRAQPMAQTNASPPCPICRSNVAQEPGRDEAGNTVVMCGNCGFHRFTDTLMEDLDDIAPDDDVRARLAHAVAQVPRYQLITAELARQLVSTTKLPPALERIDRLVMYMASDIPPGHWSELQHATLVAKLGCEGTEPVQWAIEQARELGYLSSPGGRTFVLSAKGWERHAALLRDAAGSKHAFMAMKFGDDEMDRVFAEFMQPAVSQTGFDLRTTVGDHQTAGSIDNRMRVEIRTSRFMLCDLTHGNQGAYWEAGFAEGLGRPVIYTCRRDVLETPKAVHFDTDHQLIIKWDLANMDEAMQELKATIRATLPAEAKLQDA